MRIVIRTISRILRTSQGRVSPKWGMPAKRWLVLGAVLLAGCGSSNTSARWQADWKHAEQSVGHVRQFASHAANEGIRKSMVAYRYEQYVLAAHIDAAERTEAQKVRQEEESRPQEESEAAVIERHREAERIADEHERKH